MTAMTTNTPDIQARKTLGESDPACDGMNVSERARNLYRKGKDKVLEAEDNFENYVSAHPIKSVLVAGGVGLAVGFLLGRRR